MSVRSEMSLKKNINKNSRVYRKRVHPVFAFGGEYQKRISYYKCKGGDTLEIYEEAEKDYIKGMTRKQIAEKYNVSENTVKSWIKRKGWIRVAPKKEGAPTKTQKKGAGAAVEKSGKKEEENDTNEIVCEDSELSEKSKLFCVYYVKTFNATRSYMKAYGCSYESAATSANRLLKNVKVQKYIKELKKSNRELKLFDKEDLVQKYMEIAFADIRDFVDLDESGCFIKVKKDFDGTMVGQIKNTNSGVELKLSDRMKALDWLSRYFECNPDSRLRNEYMRMQTNLLKNKETSDEEEKEKQGVVILAPVLEEKQDECIVEPTTETD